MRIIDKGKNNLHLTLAEHIRLKDSLFGVRDSRPSLRSTYCLICLKSKLLK